MSELANSSIPLFPFQSVLIANRGEIAVRLIEAAHAINLSTVAVFTEADSSALHVSVADVAIALPSSSAGYNDIDALVSIAKDQNCGAVLPGYGFISENPHAAQAFEDANVIWVGPTSEVITLFGLKHSAREAATSASIPIIPGSHLCSDAASAVIAASEVGLPVLIKASAGGGGMGQGIAYTLESLSSVYNSVVKQTELLFDSTEVFVERYVSNARHIEVQVFGDGEGKVVDIGERDCSAQRRRQKVIEEAPAPEIDPSIVQAMRKAAINLCGKHNYRSAGTVEFLVDTDTWEWYFLEVNTRLQVEHGVTEMVSGIDIVRWMLLLAGGHLEQVRREMSNELTEKGCALEARIIAENPAKDFAPSPGVLSEMQWPAEGASGTVPGAVIRVDAWARRGTVVSPDFDPLLGKILAWGRTRTLAMAALRSALRDTVIRGVATNVELLLQIIEQPEFIRGNYTTGLIASFTPQSTNIEVIAPGLQSSLQDYPGRVGYWDIGVSPSGPMDAYSMGMANALVGNDPFGTAALEMTIRGPTLKFHCQSRVALTGARMKAELDDGKPVPWWTPFDVEAGSVLTLSGIADGVNGKIAYLAIQGGFDAPKYLGSSSTFPTGKFGGIHGGFLAAGDFLPLVPNTNSCNLSNECYGWTVDEALPSWLIPSYDSNEVIVGALNGPHGSQEFFSAESLDTIWNTAYKVHHAANRLGVRLTGPTPKWTRKDGGSAGLHPSNLHDYTYAPGAVNFSGNTPIVLMLDGPSLGGFVCPITVATCEMWKVAQAPPESNIRFKQVEWDDARSAYSSMIEAWEAVHVRDKPLLQKMKTGGAWDPNWVHHIANADNPAIVMLIDPTQDDQGAEIKVTYRMSGDEHILIEYGEVELDLAYRMRVHMLMEQLKPKTYVKELCPGVRSLLVKYDAAKIPVGKLVDTLRGIEISGVMGSVDDVVVPSRLIRLPLAFNDRWTIEAQKRYLRSVRPHAPYMPSNVEFIARINGYDSVDDVRRIITSCEYCVMGLGDVYLGAPCAVPIDPRHRLVTSKYNPARTYTPEGAVGIGGAYMCIYGMDSPGGYQLCGRTLPIWDNYGSIPQKNRGSPPEIPWLLRFFDRVQYYLVSDDELEELRDRYRRGDFKIDIQEETFSYREHKYFLEKEAQSIAKFQKEQQAAFSVERARWEESGEGENDAAAKHANSNAESSTSTAASISQDSFGERERPPFSVPVYAGLSASVWSIEVDDGKTVEKGDKLITLESMKVEITIEAPVTGTVVQLAVSKGDVVSAETELCIIASSRENAMKHLGLDQLRGMYKLGVLEPRVVFETIQEKISTDPEATSMLTWRAPQEAALKHIKLLEDRKRTEYLPLFGVPFVVSDDVDISGVPTTAGCRALTKIFSGAKNIPNKSAVIVEALENAGAILIGKGNMDQLGASLTGTLSSYGVAENPIDPLTITGGSFGTSLAVARGFATFGISVDTCGTSMIPPSLAGVLGLKTTRGLVSLDGILPSLPSQDCVSVIATEAEDLRAVVQIIAATSYTSQFVRKISASRSPLRNFHMGVIELGQFNASTETMNQYETEVQILRRVGGTSVQVDCTPFITVSELMDTPEMQQAGRYSTHKHLLDCMENKEQVSVITRAAKACLRLSESKQDQVLLEPIKSLIMEGQKASAPDLATAMSMIQKACSSAVMNVWSKVDVVIFPATFPGPASVKDARRNHRLTQSKIGTFTRVITAMDLCAVTLCSGSDKIGGLLVVASARREADLLDIAEKWRALTA